MFGTEKRHSVDILFVLILFSLFALSVISVTGTGARVYQHIVDSMSDNYSERTSFSYISNKVRQGDEKGFVNVGTFAGCPALIISEEISDITYCTYLYYYDGYVREIFTRQGQEFDPSLGTAVFECNGLSIDMPEDDLIRFEIISKDDIIIPLYSYLHCQ